jgi:hypothetical protein
LLLLHNIISFVKNTSFVRQNIRLQSKCRFDFKYFSSDQRVLSSVVVYSISEQSQEQVELNVLLFHNARYSRWQRLPHFILNLK